MAGALTQKDVTGRQGKLFRRAGRQVALILRLKKPEPDTGLARKELKQKRNTARADGDYYTVAECSIALGMNEGKAWKKAGDACNKEGWYIEAARCYRKGGFEKEAKEADEKKATAKTRKEPKKTDEYDDRSHRRDDPRAYYSYHP
jgi:hypothetical protein